MSNPINDESDKWPLGSEVPTDHLFIRRKRSFGKIILTKPNYHGIALNSARVIEDFSKALEKMKDEKIALIEWLKEAVGYTSSMPMRRAYNKTLRKMGEDV